MLDNIYMLTDIEPDQWQCNRDSFLMDSGGNGGFLLPTIWDMPTIQTDSGPQPTRCR